MQAATANGGRNGRRGVLSTSQRCQRILVDLPSSYSSLNWRTMTHTPFTHPSQKAHSLDLLPVEVPGLGLRPLEFRSTVILALRGRTAIRQCGQPGLLTTFLKSMASTAITSGDPAHRTCWRVRRVGPSRLKHYRDSGSSMYYIPPQAAGVLLIATGTPPQ